MAGCSSGKAEILLLVEEKNYGQGERENNVKVYHANGALRPRPVHVQASRFEFTLNVNTFAQAFLRMDLLQVEEIPQE